MLDVKRFLLIFLAIAISLFAISAFVYQKKEPDAKNFKTMDDLLLDVGKEVSSFGGLRYNPTGDILEVYLVDQSANAEINPKEDVKQKKTKVEKAIKEVFGKHRIPTGGVQVLQGTYSMVQLRQWYDSMFNNIFTIPGVTSIDLWESENRLWVGVLDLALTPIVESELSRLGIPREAVTIEKFGPVVPNNHQNLQGAVRHSPDGGVDAGVRIADNAGVPCTLGFITLRAGSDWGIVTNHHCTFWEGVTGVVYHQPIASGTTNKLGTETIDPTFSPNLSGCLGTPPAATACRWSDSAFISKSNGGGVLTLHRGHIARPTIEAQGGPNRLLINDTKPVFPIKSERLAFSGEPIHMVGQASGWLSGSVNRTCVPISYPTTTYKYLCQDTGYYYPQNGDSGAPIFIRDTGNPDQVHIVGIHWGKDLSDGSGVYSYIGQVYLDLGQADSWDTCDPQFGC